MNSQCSEQIRDRRSFHALGDTICRIDFLPSSSYHSLIQAYATDATQNKTMADQINGVPVIRRRIQ